MTAFYPVSTAPLTAVVNGREQIVEDKKVIFNTDTNEVKSIVGKGYELIPFEETHYQVTSRLDAMGLSYDTSHKLDNNGRKLFSTYTLLDEKFRFAPESRPDDVSQGRICLFNSYDSSTSFWLTWGLFRSICANGCVFGGKTSFNERVYHTKSANPVDMVSRMINNLDSFAQVKDFYQAMSEYELNQGEGNELIKELVPDNRKEAIEEREDEFKKLWSEKLPALDSDQIQEMAENQNFTINEAYGPSIGIRRREKVSELWNTPVQDLPPEERPRNLWTMYNCFTKVVTHEISNVNTQNNLFLKVDAQFRKVLS